MCVRVKGASNEKTMASWINASCIQCDGMHYPCMHACMSVCWFDSTKDKVTGV